MSKLIVFLGRNTEGIINDTKREFGDVEVLIITRDKDSLSPPDGYQSINISDFRADEKTYTVIANGGTTAQLIPLIKTLVENSCTFEVWDLQRDGKALLW